MQKLLMVFAAVLTGAAVQAGETLLWHDCDNDTDSVKEGADLLPFVCDGTYTSVRQGNNQGFSRVPSGKQKWVDFGTAASAVKESGKELTIEFFIKGPSDLEVWRSLMTIGGTWSGADWALILSSNDSKNINLRVLAGGMIEQNVSTSLIDGKWHHVALVVTPINDGAASHIDAYVDYTRVINKDATGVFRYSACGTLDINRSGGSTQTHSGCDLDEIRFTRGALSVSEFLRLDDTLPPEDGATLLYLPFDHDANSIAYPSKNNGVVGTADFVDATRTHTAIKERGTDVKVREENLSYLQQKQLTGHDLYIYNNFYALTKEMCQTCTIEFFIMGSPLVTNWETAMCYGHWGSVGQYGLLLQVDDSKKLWVKPGVGNSDTGFQLSIDLSQEKWHHVALTIRPSTKEGCEGGSHFEAFVDYSETPVVVKDYAQAFNGLPQKRLVFNDSRASHCAIDELRVTKGVLPVSKFLAFAKRGLFIVVQ